MPIGGKGKKKAGAKKAEPKAEAEVPKVAAAKAEKKKAKAEQPKKEEPKKEAPKKEAPKEDKTRKEKSEVAKEAARKVWGELRAKRAKRKASGEKKPKQPIRRTKANRLVDAQAKAESGSDDEEDEKKKKAQDLDKEPRGVVYIGHLPNAFAEPQLRQYFHQFGRVRRIRISRSKKNAHSKGYGWVEFQQASVAKIVAQTMNGYMMFGKQLKVHVVNPDQIHPALFKGCTKVMKDRSNDRQKKYTDAYNNRPTILVDGEQVPRQSHRQERRRSDGNAKLKARLAALEVQFNPEDFIDTKSEKSKAAKVTADTVKAAAKAAEKADVAEGKVQPVKKKRKAV